MKSMRYPVACLLMATKFGELIVRHEQSSTLCIRLGSGNDSLDFFRIRTLASPGVDGRDYIVVRSGAADEGVFVSRSTHTECKWNIRSPGSRAPIDVIADDRNSIDRRRRIPSQSSAVCSRPVNQSRHQGQHRSEDNGSADNE